jgi:hypothetical protein
MSCFVQISLTPGTSTLMSEEEGFKWRRTKHYCLRIFRVNVRCVHWTTTVTGMRRITTILSTMDHIYDSGPII